MQRIVDWDPVDPINVHYVFSMITGAIDDFKITLHGQRR